MSAMIPRSLDPRLAAALLALASPGAPPEDGARRPLVEEQQEGAANAADSPFEVPPGAVAEALASVRPDTVPARIPGAPWPDWAVREAGQGWGDAETWLRWARLVREEAAADAPDALRRARLALCARSQGRDRDAWDHLVAAAGDPTILAALLPRFVPGVTTRPGDAPGGNAGAAGEVAAGGLPSGVRSGDLLRPALPPALDEGLARRLGIYTADCRLRSLQVGASRVSFALELSVEGVEIEVLHQEGPPVELRFVLPAPRSQTIRTVYANWKRLDDPTAPVLLRVSAEDPEGEIWGRFFPRSARWPETLPDGVDARVRAGAVRVVGDPENAFLAGLCAGLGALLETEVQLVAPGTPPLGPREPLDIRVGAGSDGEAKLLALLSRAEAYVLRDAAYAREGD